MKANKLITYGIQYIKQIINENIAIKIQKYIDKTKRWCYYKTIKKNKRKNKKSEIHSIHSIDAHERMKKGKGDSSGNINKHHHQYESDRNRISCKKDLIHIT